MAEPAKHSTSSVEEMVSQLGSAETTLLVEELARVLPPETYETDHSEFTATSDALHTDRGAELKPFQLRGDTESPPPMSRNSNTQQLPGFIAIRSILRKFASLAVIEYCSIFVAIGACVFLLYTVASSGNSSTAAIDNGPAVLFSICVICVFSLMAFSLHFARLVRN